MLYSECLKPITAGNGPGAPPTAFLDELFRVIAALPDEVFAPNERPDLYSVLAPKLGPWKGTLHRRAALACALMVDAGFESGWNWNEGADTTAGYETPVEQETGAWQVSANSLGFDSSLKDCLARYAGAVGNDETREPHGVGAGGVSGKGARMTNADAQLTVIFIACMKSNHALAVEYAARLFRFNTRWSGPCNRSWITRAVTPAAVAEIETFLS